MTLALKGETSASPSLQELNVYMRTIHPAFQTVEDYGAATRFFVLRYPKLQDILEGLEQELANHPRETPR
jgi:hypothetical protein